MSIVVCSKRKNTTAVQQRSWVRFLSKADNYCTPQNDIEDPTNLVTLNQTPSSPKGPGNESRVKAKRL